MGCIYLIYFNGSENVYVGSTIDFKERKLRHLLHLRNNRHDNNLLQKAFNKYGESNINIEIFEPDISNEDLLPWEQACFELFQNKYNICEFAGNTLGQQIWLGKTHTKETKKRISESLIGKPKSEETKKRISESHIGLEYSQEYKDNMSINTQKTHCKNGHKFTKETTIMEYRHSNGRTSKRCKPCRSLYYKNKKGQIHV